MADDNKTDCLHQDDFATFQYTTDDLLLAGSMASTVFNVLVMFCAIKLFKRSGDTMHLFILNMTLGDLVLTVFCNPNELLIRKHAFLQKEKLCMIVHYFNWVGVAVSGGSLTLLNVDKLIYFRWPLSYDRSMSTRRAVLFCLLIWATSLGFTSFCWIAQIIRIHPRECTPAFTTAGNKVWYQVFVVMFCVFPVISSVVVSVYLFKLTRQKRNSTLIGGAADQKTFRNKVKSLVFIFATTAWTACSLLPYRIFNMFRIHLFEWGALSCKQREAMTWVSWILIYLLIINPIINPFITSFIYAPYRLTIKRFLVNIPGGTHPLYESDSVSNRLIRRRGSGGHELCSIRHSTDTVRMSDPPLKSPRPLSDGIPQSDSF